MATRRPGSACGRRTRATVGVVPVIGSTPLRASIDSRQNRVPRAQRSATSRSPDGAQPSQLHGGVDRHQGLVGADVRGGLLAPDVLLACPQGGDVGPGPLDVDRLAHQPARQPAHVLLPPRRTARGRGRRSSARSRGPGPRRRRHRPRTPPASAGGPPTPDRPPRPAGPRSRRRSGGPRRCPRGSPDSSGSRRPARPAARRRPAPSTRASAVTPSARSGHVDQHVTGAGGEGRAARPASAAGTPAESHTVWRPDAATPRFTASTRAFAPS